MPRARRLLRRCVHRPGRTTLFVVAQNFTPINTLRDKITDSIPMKMASRAEIIVTAIWTDWG